MFCPSFSEHIYLSIRSTRPTAPHKYSPPCSSGQEALRRAQTEMDTSIGRTGNGARKVTALFKHIWIGVSRPFSNKCRSRGGGSQALAMYRRTELVSSRDSDKKKRETAIYEQTQYGNLIMYLCILPLAFPNKMQLSVFL